MPKLSIVTVNLNNLAGLKKTTENLFSQTYKEFEFIIIDGNSSDGSKQYIQEISEHVSLWVSEPDTGIYNAMNKGIRMATGDYICFLNSGDIFFNDHTLEDFVNKANENIDIYYGDVLWDLVRKKKLIPAPKNLSYSHFLTDNICHQSSFIKRSLFDEIFYYNEDFKTISDWEFFIYAVCKKEVSTKHLDMVVSIYDTSGVSSYVDYQKKIMEDRQSVIDKHFPLFKFNLPEIETINSRRGKQFLYIKKHKIAYKILKGMMSLLLVFLPKFSAKEEN